MLQYFLPCGKAANIVGNIITHLILYCQVPLLRPESYTHRSSSEKISFLPAYTVQPYAGLLKPLLTAEAVGQIEDERNCKDSQDHGVDQHRHDVGGNKFHVQGGHGREDGDLQAEAAGHLDGL